jgi:outer membrane protein assembly factor BamB
MRASDARRSTVPAAILVALISAVPFCAPRAAEPAWTRDFAVPIAWQRVTAYGHLLVETRDGLFAVEPTTGAVRWKRLELGGFPAGGFKDLPGTPLAMLTDTALPSRTVIVNVFTGALVFDSRAENIAEIASTHVLPRSASLLVAGIESGKAQPTLFLYEMEHGKRLWSSDALTAGMNRLASLLLAAAVTVARTTPVQSEPLELDDGSFLLGAMGNLYRFEQATGKVLWKTPFAGGTFALQRADQRPGAVYVGAEDVQQQTMGADQTPHEFVTTLYQGFRIDDGHALWKKPVKFNQPMNRLVIPLDRGLVVSDGDKNKGRMQLLEYDSGAPLWGAKGKGIEISGQVVDYSFAGADLVLTTGYDSVWTGKDTEYLIYVLDPSAGALRFAKPFAVKGRMLGTELANGGLAYVTTHEINVFDPATGALRNAPVLRAKQPLVTAEDGRILYAFNSDDGFVYRFDRDSGAIARFSTVAFAFTDHDQARALDVVDGRVVLLGQQTVAGFREDGALAFNSHYAAPRDPAWIRSLAWAEAVRAGMASAYAGAYSAAAASAAAQTQQGSVGHDVAEQLERGFGDLQHGYAGLASEYASFARRRYEASAAARDFVFLLTQKADRTVALVQVSKRDGRTISSIDLQHDKEPDYQVDDVSSYVYYRPSDSVVKAYRFSAEQVRVAVH